MTALIPQHWTASYVHARVRQQLFKRRYPGLPCLTRKAIDFLEEWLRPNDQGVEWGSGASTLWFAARCGHLLSIEHDPSWHARVTRDLAKQGLATVDFRYVPLELQPHRAESHPYVATVAGVIDPGSRDFVLVDGRMREFCMPVAMRILRCGGLLILDDAQRYLRHPSPAPYAIEDDRPWPSPQWESISREISNWRRYWTTDGVSDTVLLFKPA